MEKGISDINIKRRYLTKNTVYLLVMCLIGSVVGCGQSGPLYLPDQKPPIKTAPCATCP